MLNDLVNRLFLFLTLGKEMQYLKDLHLELQKLLWTINEGQSKLTRKLIDDWLDWKVTEGTKLSFKVSCCIYTEKIDQVKWDNCVSRLSGINAELEGCLERIKNLLFLQEKGKLLSWIENLPSGESIGFGGDGAFILITKKDSLNSLFDICLNEGENTFQEQTLEETMALARDYFITSLLAEKIRL